MSLSRDNVNWVWRVYKNNAFCSQSFFLLNLNYIERRVRMVFYYILYENCPQGVYYFCLFVKNRRRCTNLKFSQVATVAIVIRFFFI